MILNNIFLMNLLYVSSSDDSLMSYSIALIVGLITSVICFKNIFKRKNAKDELNILSNGVPDINGGKVEVVLAKVICKRSLNIDSYILLHFATFELETDGSRIELLVSMDIYGLLADGDKGILNYQNDVHLKNKMIDLDLTETKFIKFDRIIE